MQLVFEGCEVGVVVDGCDGMVCERFYHGLDVLILSQ